MTYCEGLAFLSLLPSALPSFEAVESRFKLLEDGVAPLDPEGVVFKEEAMSLIKRKTRQMAYTNGLGQVTFGFKKNGNSCLSLLGSVQAT